MSVIPAALGGTFRSLRERNYKLFFWGQVVSTSGTWMQTIALGWLVVELSHKSGIAVGAVIACQYLPMLFFGAWGGMLADRHSKRLVLMIAESAMAVGAAILAVLTIAGVVQLWMIYVIVLFIGCAQAVDTPTRQAFVPEMVITSELPNAVALNSSIYQFARIFGPALAGLFIVSVGTGVCFATNAVSFLAVIFALFAMRDGELYRGAPVERAKGQIREGMRYIWHTPALRATLLLTAVVGTFAINYPVVLPLLAGITFAGNGATYSFFTIAMGAGALGGAFTAAMRTDVPGHLLFRAGLAYGVAICVAAAAPSFGLVLVFLATVGACHVLFLASCNSFLQLRSDSSMHGRVMAVYTITLLGTTPIGGPFIGWISQEFGPRWGLAVGGIATLAAVVAFGALFVRTRTRDDTVDLRDDADRSIYTNSVRGIDSSAPAPSSATAGTGSGSVNSAASL